MQKIKKNLDIILAASFFVLFVGFTLLVKFAFVLPVGPNGSQVGFGKINEAVHNFFGMNQTLYVLTDWLGVLAFVLMFIFAIIGFVQWIKRKSLLKVDSEILALGIFYVLVAASYVFFEIVVINRRPVLLEGVLEASYPSSTTMLCLMVCYSSIWAIKKLVKNQTAAKIINICLIVFACLMVTLRLISGVHWLTDILGGIILSISFIFVYKFILRTINQKLKKSE